MAGSLIERRSVAAPRHLVIAEPGRIGVHGWSHGASPTPVALTRWPGLFAAGARLAGMSDTLFAGTERWMAPASVTEYGGRPTNVPVVESVQTLGAPSHLVELGERIAGWFDRWL